MMREMTVYRFTREPGSHYWTGESVSDDGSPRVQMTLQDDQQMIDFVRGATADPGRCVVSIVCGKDTPRLAGYTKAA